MNAETLAEGLKQIILEQLPKLIDLKHVKKEISYIFSVGFVYRKDDEVDIFLPSITLLKNDIKNEV